MPGKTGWFSKIGLTMLGKSLLYLSKNDVEETDLGMREIITSLESMFKEKGEGKVEMPPNLLSVLPRIIWLSKLWL